MQETVKVVNGYSITRMKGTHGYFTVYLNKNGERFGAFVSFKTIKSAVAFCETL